MLKASRILKCAIATCILSIAFFGGANLSYVGNVSAAPFVDIDYGEYNGNIHVWWSVDKGSYDRSELYDEIDVTLEDEHCSREQRTYRFFETKQGWKYTWYGYSGKGARITKKGGSEYVSSDRLANDILYIALH